MERHDHLLLQAALSHLSRNDTVVELRLRVRLSDSLKLNKVENPTPGRLYINYELQEGNATSLFWKVMDTYKMFDQILPPECVQVSVNDKFIPHMKHEEMKVFVDLITVLKWVELGKRPDYINKDYISLTPIDKFGSFATSLAKRHVNDITQVIETFRDEQQSAKKQKLEEEKKKHTNNVCSEWAKSMADVGKFLGDLAVRLHNENKKVWGLNDISEHLKRLEHYVKDRNIFKSMEKLDAPTDRLYDGATRIVYSMIVELNDSPTND
jgi:hypothetical protein